MDTASSNRPVLFSVAALVWLVAAVLVVRVSDARGPSAGLAPVPGMSNAAGYYMPSRTTASRTAPEALLAEPDYAGTPWYGSFEWGQGSDRVYTYVLDEPDGSEARFYLDANNNEDLTDDGDGMWDTYGPRTDMARRDVMVEYVQDGAIEEVPLRFMFYRFNGQDPTERAVLYARDFARVGTVLIGGVPYKVGIAENTNDGVFDLVDPETGQPDPDAISFTVDINRDGKLETSSASAEHFRGSEPFNVGGESYILDSVTPMGDAVTFAVSPVKVEPKAYIAVGYPAPRFVQADTRGRPVRLDDFLQQHKVVLLDFWATWCGPCIEELPNVIAVYEKYKDQGLGILGISMDGDPGTPADAVDAVRTQVAAFITEHRMEWPTTLDGQGWENAVGQMYRVNAIPATFLLDSGGTIRFMNARGDQLEPAVRELLEAAGGK